MKLIRYIALAWCLSVGILQLATAQNERSDQQESAPSGGRLSGSLEATGNFFMKDTAIGAANIPQYEHQLFGADAWINLNYSNWGFDFGIRYDVFNNSNLLNPTGSYTASGIGMWYVKKKIDKFGIYGGYIYDQIGNGTIFRAFEERPLAIDNALVGVRLSYDFLPDWTAKVFTGRQKQQFGLYDAVIKGGSVDGFLSGKDGKWTMTPGFGVVNRTHDDETVKQIVSAISTYTKPDSIGACYNTFAFSAYNTLTFGNFSWVVEGAYKTSEVFNDPFAEKTQWNGDKALGKLVNRPGNIIYTSLSYSREGLGISLEAKRTENFTFRTNPFVLLNRGTINFLPPMTRQNTYRLTARYQAASQELGEKAIQADVRYSFNEHLSCNVNFSNITNLDNKLLYREIFTEIAYKVHGKWSALGGLQLQNYNQEIYETKPQVPIVKTVIPYAEFLYKFTRKQALRVELQYMDTHEDYGSWVFLLAEYSIAPKWIFTCSDMYNIRPKKTDKLHYPTVGVVFTQGPSRFSLNFVKQVQGVVCTGGICRLEPAFSGVKLNVSSSF